MTTWNKKKRREREKENNKVLILTCCQDLRRKGRNNDFDFVWREKVFF
jgi:hypothetical protein